MTMTTTTVTAVTTRRPPPLRSIFLSLLGCIHLVAFWSYYTQFPGLLSSSGIEPALRFFPHAAPTIYNLIERVDVDAFCETCALVGMLIAAIVSLGTCHHGLLFIILTALYSLLVRTGGVFYSFQWDTLLLETTFVTALTYAPWRFNKSATNNNSAAISSWPLRWLLFKLMLMSGVVKLQSRCPTWLKLTALEYHFATQCLPGPLAWHAHQLPPFVLRISVAVTLWLEMPVTLLLLIPNLKIQQVGAVLQMVLQITIILTGNYNFFNILTMALCLPVMEHDTIDDNKRKRRRWMDTISLVTACIFLVWSFWYMFEFEGIKGWRSLNIRLDISPQDVDQWTTTLLPVVVNATLVWVVLVTFYQTYSRRSVYVLLQGIVCVVVLVLAAMPMSSLTPTLRRFPRKFWGMKQLQPLYYNYIQPYRLSNGYGLFRRMTGVGKVPNNYTGSGWAGLPPSVVARPEIVLEGKYGNAGDSNSTQEWHELEFRWKPGFVKNMPRQVAPHQPRLDWQMWFAALSEINTNPWLVHFVKKLLDGCEPVWELLDNNKNGKRLYQIRAKLYHYDFTRVDTEWNKIIPGAEILSSCNSSGGWWTRLLTIQPQKVWHRTFVRYYMPPLDATNESLLRYLRQHGYKDNVCVDHQNRCINGTKWCHVTQVIRQYHLHLTVPVFVVAIGILRLFRNIKTKLAMTRWRQTREQPPAPTVAAEKKNQ